MNSEADPNRTQAISAVFGKEMRSTIRSVLFTASLMIVCVLSLLIALDVFFLQYRSNFDYVLPQYFVGSVFQTAFPFLYLIIIIQPAISISEERESGNWDMISIFKGKRSSLLIGKVIWQVTCSMILLLASFLTTFIVGVVAAGHLQISEFTLKAVSQSSSLSAIPTSKYIITRTFFSLVDIYLEYAVGILVTFTIIFEGLLISSLTRKKITSVAVSIFLFLLVFMSTQFLPSLNASNSTKFWYGIIENLNPGNMFGIFLYLSDMQPYHIAPSGRPGEVVNISTSPYLVSTINAVLPFSYMLEEYLILSIALLLVFYIIGVKSR
ncbi:MAG: hypothetical protein ACP5OC_08260 [Thermoplasmata archaeon]